MRRWLALLYLTCLVPWACGAMPSGIGVNCHTIRIPSFLSLYPFAKWVRVDDVAPGSWSVSNAQTLVSYYTGLGMKVVYVISTAWGSSVVGHARDVAALVQPDVLEIYNEPQYDASTSAGAQAADIQHVMQWGMAGIANRPLIAGPCCANLTWTDANGMAANSKRYSDAFIAAGGGNYIDVVTWHPYPRSGPPAPETKIPAAAASIKGWYPGKPLLWTEFTPGPGDPANLNNPLFDETYALYGVNWTASNDAAVYYRSIAAAVPDPFCVYDGPWDGNQYESLVQSNGTSASAQLTALVSLSPGTLYP